MEILRNSHEAGVNRSPPTSYHKTLQTVKRQIQRLVDQLTVRIKGVPNDSGIFLIMLSHPIRSTKVDLPYS